jgi:hypothetical protein
MSRKKKVERKFCQSHLWRTPQKAEIPATAGLTAISCWCSGPQGQILLLQNPGLGIHDSPIKMDDPLPRLMLKNKTRTGDHQRHAYEYDLTRPIFSEAHFLKLF